MATDARYPVSKGFDLAIPMERGLGIHLEFWFERSSKTSEAVVKRLLRLSLFTSVDRLRCAP